MKDSGVGLLGEVPAHWAVRRLAQIGKLSKGSGGNKDDEVSIGVPCIRYGDLYTTHEFFIRRSRSFISKEKAADYTAIEFGDVLFAGSGETIDEIGKSAVNLMRQEAYCGGDVILFSPEQQVEAPLLGLRLGLPTGRHPEGDNGSHVRNAVEVLDYPASSPPRTDRDRPLSRPRRPPCPALHQRQAEAGHAAGGAEAGHRPAGRHPRPRPDGQPYSRNSGQHAAATFAATCEWR